MTTTPEHDLWDTWRDKVQAKITDPDWLEAAYDAMKDAHREVRTQSLSDGTGHTMKIEPATWEAWKELARKRGTGAAALTREAMRVFLEADRRHSAEQDNSQQNGVSSPTTKAFS